jgi:hypothetical protein
MGSCATFNRSWDREWAWNEEAFSKRFPNTIPRTAEGDVSGTRIEEGSRAAKGPQPSAEEEARDTDNPIPSIAGELQVTEDSNPVLEKKPRAGDGSEPTAKKEPQTCPYCNSAIQLYSSAGSKDSKTAAGQESLAARFLTRAVEVETKQEKDDELWAEEEPPARKDLKYEDSSELSELSELSDISDF